MLLNFNSIFYSVRHGTMTLIRKVTNLGSFRFKIWLNINSIFLILSDMEQWFSGHGSGMGWCLSLGTWTTTTRSIAATFPSDRSEPVRLHRCVLLQYIYSSSLKTFYNCFSHLSRDTPIYISLNWHLTEFCFVFLLFRCLSSTLQS